MRSGRRWTTRASGRGFASSCCASSPAFVSKSEAGSIFRRAAPSSPPSTNRPSRLSRCCRSLPFPTFVVKRELKWVPLFGLYTITSGMIHVDRGGGAAALEARWSSGRARRSPRPADHHLSRGDPQAARRAAGLPLRRGAPLRSLDVPVVPVALNCGLFWPRRRFLRYPGTAVIEFLPPIPPDLDAKAFAAALQETVEAASDRLAGRSRASGRTHRRFPKRRVPASRAFSMKSALVPPESSRLGRTPRSSLQVEGRRDALQHRVAQAKSTQMRHRIDDVVPVGAGAGRGCRARGRGSSPAQAARHIAGGAGRPCRSARGPAAAPHGGGGTVRQTSR